jgi:hypothetical protein
MATYWKAAVLAALGVAGVASWATPVFAHKAFLDRARKIYQLDAKNGKCDLCHEVKPKEEPGAKNLNVFGKALAADPDMKPLLGKKEEYKFSDAEIKVFEKAVAKLDSADSDGDGATNKEELWLGTNPGDAKSVPDKRALTKYRKDNPGK